LRARVTGFLEQRGFQDGGDVQAGQTLFEIEPDQYRATLAQAEASVAAAEASLNRARVDLKRYQELRKNNNQELRKNNNVSQQEVDKAQAEVLVQEAAVATARADVQKITAPIDGRIDVAAFDVGNLIGPDSGVLATINRMDPIYVGFSLAETWYLNVSRVARQRSEQGGNVDAAAFVPRLRLADGSLYEHPGRFDFVGNQVDEATGTVQVRAEFPNPDGLLLPGQFATVIIERADAVDAILLPQAAMLTDQGGSYVLLVNDEDVVQARRIRTGQRFGANVVVVDGLAAGERVVLYGIQKVRPGLKVTPELSAGPSDPAAQATAELPPDGTEVPDGEPAEPADVEPADAEPVEPADSEPADAEPANASDPAAD